MFFISSPTGLVWSETSASQYLSPNTGTIATNTTGTIVLTLPTTCPIGAEIVVTQINNGLFRLAQGAGQSIIFADSASTVGTGGFVESTNRGNSIGLVCVQPDLLFLAIQVTGTFFVN